MICLAPGHQDALLSLKKGYLCAYIVGARVLCCTAELMFSEVIAFYVGDLGTAISRAQNRATIGWEALGIPGTGWES